MGFLSVPYHFFFTNIEWLWRLDAAVENLSNVLWTRKVSFDKYCFDQLIYKNEGRRVATTTVRRTHF